MTEVLLFHHAHGQTAGFLAFADALRRAGHSVHAPDLYNGRTFDTLDEGVVFAGEIGFGEIIERGVRAADELPSGVVYAGFSLGVLPAQKLAQTRPGARGRCCSTRVCRRRSSGPRGRWTYRCRSTRWRQTRSSWTRVTSMPPARSSSRPSTRTCFYTPVISTCSPTTACRPTTQTLPHCSAGACSTSSEPADANRSTDGGGSAFVAWRVRLAT